MRLITLLFAIALVGCRPELSHVNGVSIRSPEYQGWGQIGDHHLLGHTLMDLGERSVLPRSQPSERVVSFVESEERYDVEIADPGRQSEDAIKEAVKATFGVMAIRGTRELDVLVLVTTSRDQRGLTSVQPSRPDATVLPVELCRHGLSALLPRRPAKKTFTFHSITMPQLAAFLEGPQMVILDETGLQGNFDFTVELDEPKGETLNDALRKVNLELRPARRQVQAIYVEVANPYAPVKVNPLRDRYRQRNPSWSMVGSSSSGKWGQGKRGHREDGDMLLRAIGPWSATALLACRGRGPACSLVRPRRPVARAELVVTP